MSLFPYNKINKQQLGANAEKHAELFLKQHQYKTLQKNYASRFGEIDLIMCSPNDEIVFVEVRYRKNNDYGGAIESVTPTKQEKIRKTALTYLQKNHLSDRDCRFDVIALQSSDNHENIEWIENAF